MTLGSSQLKRRLKLAQAATETRSVPIYLKILVRADFAMLLDIGADLFLRYATHRRTKIAPRPKMLSPIPLLQVRKLVLQLPRRGPFQIRHHFRRTQHRGTRYQQMHMFLAYMPCYNRDIPTHTDLANQFPRPQRHFARQHGIAILSDPHKVVVDIIDRMRTTPIIAPQGLLV